jgi:hypothetical protein
MDHVTFKANHTAASYVANGLDENALEAFELHMMRCLECTQEVETWRAIKIHMPQPVVASPLAVRRRAGGAFGTWPIAAVFVGAAVGWWGIGGTSADLNSTQTVVFNLSALPRGVDECTAIRLAADTQVALLRIELDHPGPIVALDSQKRELPEGHYFSHAQADGSQLLRIDSELLTARTVHLYVRYSGGSLDPVGCVTGAVALR